MDPVTEARDKMNEAKTRFVAIFNDQDVDRGKMIKMIIKIIATQIPYARVMTAFVKVLKSDLKDNAPDILFDWIVEYIGTYVEDAADIMALVGKINQTASEQKDKIKKKFKSK